MTERKARPILFSGEMVRAILDGRKTQTRRVVKPQPGNDNRIPWPGRKGVVINIRDERVSGLSPYGTPGDLLWVRETFQGPLMQIGDAEEYWRDGSEKFECPDYCEYAADGGPPPEFVDADDEHQCRWKPSIHMPRWASRITLEITDVRVEQLKNIRYDDAISEGVTVFNEDGVNLYYSGVSFDPESWFDEPYKWHLDGPCEAFYELWDSINFDRGAGVATNPWVWVIQFRAHQMNVDRFLEVPRG